MNLLNQTLMLYIVTGVAVAGAVYLASGSNPAERWFRVATAVPFWPLYLPILLARQGTSPEERPPSALPPLPDDLAASIGQVDGELEAALLSLDGWAEGVLTREKGRIHELRSTWMAQADRIREMDRILALPENSAAEASMPGLTGLASTGASQVANGERLRNSCEARRQNVARLRSVRQRAYDDLMGSLAWVRELVSMIHLARFTGAPAARAEELVAQIAAAVEGLSELTWSEP
jgi:hypothetical protein